MTDVLPKRFFLKIVCSLANWLVQLPQAFFTLYCSKGAFLVSWSMTRVVEGNEGGIYFNREEQVKGWSRIHPSLRISLFSYTFPAMTSGVGSWLPCNHIHALTVMYSWNREILKDGRILDQPLTCSLGEGNKVHCQKVLFLYIGGYNFFIGFLGQFIFPLVLRVYYIVCWDPIL